MKYRQERLPEPRNSEIASTELNDLLLTKFDAWNYESEYRCFCRLADSLCEGGLYFEPFSDNLKLAEVIVSSRATITRNELNAALGEKGSHVVSFKTQPASDTFSVIKNSSGIPWE